MPLTRIPVHSPNLTLKPRGRKENRKLTVTPAQVAAPVQLEALPVAVRRADGEPVTRQEVWSPRAALSQSLRLVQLLTLRTLVRSRGGHDNISRIPKTTRFTPPPKDRSEGSSTQPSQETSGIRVLSAGLLRGRRGVWTEEV